MSSQVAKVKREREELEACMTCPLCNKLLKEATTISLCLHTFCRKCIYEKLLDEEVDCCPVCNIDLGCLPVEKLRPDHNLQAIRAKIFPLKRRKVSAHEVPSSVSLPAKRKERSLSSLVVSAPKVSMQTALTRRRTKTVPRRASLRGCSFPNEGPVKREESVEDHPASSSSPEPQSKVCGDKMQMQVSSMVKSSYEQKPMKDSANDGEVIEGKVDLWTPLNFLVEAANRTKSSTSCTQGLTSAKLEPQKVPDYGLCINDYKTSAVSPNAPNSEMYMCKTKMKGPKYTKVKNKSNGTTLLTGQVKCKRIRAGIRKKLTSSGKMCASAQVMLDASEAKDIRRKNPIWFSLVPSKDRKGDVSLPHISACYLRIKDGKMPVSIIQKYLEKKLGLNREAEVEILCQGQPVLPTLQLQNLVDLWVRTASTSKKVPVSVGSSAKDFMMVLSYCRKVQNN